MKLVDSKRLETPIEKLLNLTMKNCQLQAENARLREQLAALEQAAVAANIALFERWPPERYIEVAYRLNKALCELRPPQGDGHR